MKASYGKILDLVVIFLIPVFNLGFTSVYIPNSMNISEFADWRFASSLISFAGILHLGVADGLYIRWLDENSETPIASRSFILYVLLLIILNALIVVVSMHFYGFLNTAALWALFIVFVSSCMFSFSSYFTLIFLKSNQFKIAIASQTGIFVLCVVLAKTANIFTAPIVIVSYAISCTALNIFALSKFTLIEENGGVNDVFDLIKSGFPILIANLLIILFINFDKLYARFILGSDISYAEYSIKSSIFAAACGIGLSLGAFLVSKRFNFFKHKYRLFIIFGVLCLATLAAPLMSNLLNTIIRGYVIDYKYFCSLSLFSLFIFSTYISYLKFHQPKTCQKIFFIFPVAYCLIIAVATKYFYLSFAQVSATVLLAFLVLVVLIMEYKGGDQFAK